LGQLVLIARIVRHQPVLRAVVEDELPADVLHDRRVAVGVFDRQVQGGLMAVRLHHRQLDVAHQGDRLIDGSRVIQQVLGPQGNLQGRPGRVALGEPGRLQVQRVSAEALFVEPVDRPDAVHGNGHAAVPAFPFQRVFLNDVERADLTAVALIAARGHRQNWFGRFGPVHRPPAEYAQVIIVPEHASAHGIPP
jgi:hypothetical protein